MRHLHIYTIAIILMLSFSASLTTTTLAADSREDESVIECGSLQKTAASNIKDDRSVKIALELIARCDQIDSAAVILQRAASLGSSRARLQLGLLLMSDISEESPKAHTKQDRKSAQKHLSLVKGEFTYMATVLMGINLLEQSEDDPIKRKNGQYLLQKAKKMLDRAFESQAKISAHTSKTYEFSMRLYEASAVLEGASQRFNVELP